MYSLKLFFAPSIVPATFSPRATSNRQKHEGNYLLHKNNPPTYDTELTTLQQHLRKISTPKCHKTTFSVSNNQDANK